MPDTPEFDASDPDFEGQDMAEVWDEDNQDSDTRRVAAADEELSFDTLPDVYDATKRVGDDDDDDALIGEEMDDEDIVELSAQDDDADADDDDYRLMSAEAFDDEDEDELDTDEDEFSLDRDVARLSPDEVDLEDAGDLNNSQGALGSAKRYESSRLSDEEIERLGYGPETHAGAAAPEARSFDPAADRTPAENARHDRQDALLDQGVEETFPASDPVSVKHIT